MLPWCKQSCTQCVIFAQVPGRLFTPLLPYAAFFTHESHGGLRQDRNRSQWTCPHAHSVSRASGGYMCETSSARCTEPFFYIWSVRMTHTWKCIEQTLDNKYCARRVVLCAVLFEVDLAAAAWVIHDRQWNFTSCTQSDSKTEATSDAQNYIFFIIEYQCLTYINL